MNTIRNNLFLILCPALFISVITTSFSIAADTEVKVFKIQNRFAEEFEGVVRVFLSPEGRVVTDRNTNSLIINDYPENINAIAEFLKEQDRMPQQVRIRFRYIDETSLKETGLTVNWYYRDSHWAAGNVIGAGTGLEIDALLSSGKVKRRISGQQNLLVLSGSDGRIESGVSVSYTDWFYYYSRRHGYLLRETKFRDVATGFIVNPRVIGNNIHIFISPRISYTGEGGIDEIIFREASATIISKDGETVFIGSGNRSDENIVWNILGRALSQKSEESFYIMLTAEIMK
ncbi:MAG: secretin N-terminal domain-containing protein [Nitrospirota bacterium]